MTALHHHTIAFTSAAAALANALPYEYVMLDGATGHFWVMDRDEREAVINLRMIDGEARSAFRWTTWSRQQ